VSETDPISKSHEYL